jgi:hypothetical protein
MLNVGYLNGKDLGTRNTLKRRGFTLRELKEMLK